MSEVIQTKYPSYLTLPEDAHAHISLGEYLEIMEAQDEWWVAQGTGRWVGSLVTELDHWHEYGIYTAEQLAQYLDACCEANMS